MKKKILQFLLWPLLKLKMFLVAIWSQFFAPYSDIHSYFPFDHDVENPIIDFFSLWFSSFQRNKSNKNWIWHTYCEKKNSIFSEKAIAAEDFLYPFCTLDICTFSKWNFLFSKNSSYWNSGIYSMAFATDILLAEMQSCQGSLI